MEISKIKKELQKTIGAIRKDWNEAGGMKSEFPKAMMTRQQMAKGTATVNCGGEHYKADHTKLIAQAVMADELFKTFLEKCEATATLELNAFNTYQIRIHY